MHFSTIRNIVVSVDYVSNRLIPTNRTISVCSQFRHLKLNKFRIQDTKLQQSDQTLPIMELLFAISCRNFGILNTTDGNVKNELCDISNRKSDAKSANSSGSLDIWLCDKFRSGWKNRNCNIENHKTIRVISLTCD